ncbi:MAG: hypothetical protein JJU10_04175 [Idiomarina sp.]|nr:hypothetical protein [Idiomarina sp.]
MSLRSTGYAMLVLVLVLMSTSTALLVAQGTIAHSQRIAATELTAQRLHEARLMLAVRWSQRLSLTSEQWLFSVNEGEALQELREVFAAASVELDPVLRLRIGRPLGISLQEIQAKLPEVSEEQGYWLLRIPDLIHTDTELVGRLSANATPLGQNIELGEHSIFGVKDALATQVHTQAMSTPTIENDELGVRQAQVSEWLSEELDTQRLNAGEINVDKLSGDSLTAIQARFENSLLNSLLAQNGQVNHLDAERIEAELAQFAAVMSQSTMALSGEAAEEIEALAARIVAMERDINACWNEHLWCRAPETPTVTWSRCIGCEAEAPDALFRADIQITGGTCVHGCELILDHSPNVELACDRADIPASLPIDLNCSVQAQLELTDKIQEQFAVILANAKNTSYRTIQIFSLAWERVAAECPVDTIYLPIEDSVPLAIQTYMFSATPAGVRYRHDFEFAQCSQAFPFSFAECRMDRQCRTDGTWAEDQSWCHCSQR